MPVIETRGADPAKEEKKFEKLDKEWRDGIDNMNADEISVRISDIAKEEELNQQKLKADPEINQLKDSLKPLLEPYKDASKGAKLRIKYCVKKLQDKGVL